MRWWRPAKRPTAKRSISTPSRSVLKRHLDAEARIEFIGLLWAMAYADGRADELEDNTVWRVAELIGVDSRDRIAARQRIKASIAGAADGPGVSE